MEHIFLINTTAGDGKEYKKRMDDIRLAAAEEKINCRIICTDTPLQASQLVEHWCDKAQKVRFYACGGDGTLQTVAAAAVGHKNAEVGVIPAGTGNDFVRNFCNPHLFDDMKEQIQGEAHPIDMIEYTEQNTGFCTYGVNMVNIGFDADVAAQMQILKRHPLFGGKQSYLFGVAFILCQRLGKQMKVIVDGEPITGEFLLTAIANGGFCGGGFKAAPGASLTDGFLDLNIIKKMGRAGFLSLVGKYKKGTHLESPQGKKVVLSFRCKEAEIHLPEAINICIDGEIRQEKELTLRVKPGALYFSAPRACWKPAEVFEKIK